jgi:LacI family transcriptional regulator
MYSEGDYWELVCNGIKNAAADMENFNISVDFFQFNQYNRKSFTKAVETMMEQNYEGVLLATLFGRQVIEVSKCLSDKKIPFIYIDSAIEQQNDLAYYGGDSYQDGLIAAKLLLKEIGTSSDIFFAHIYFKYREISVQMKTREQGFMDNLQKLNFKGKIHHLEINNENHQKNLKLLSEIIDKNDGKIGGIVLNSRIYELVAMLQNLDKEKHDKIVLLGHEAIPKNIDALRTEQITYLLSQRPERQGYDALKALGNYILFDQTPEKLNFMPIDILIKENVEYYA